MQAALLSLPFPDLELAITFVTSLMAPGGPYGRPRARFRTVEGSDNDEIAKFNQWTLSKWPLKNGGRIVASPSVQGGKLLSALINWDEKQTVGDFAKSRLFSLDV